MQITSINKSYKWDDDNLIVVGLKSLFIEE